MRWRTLLLVAGLLVGFGCGDAAPRRSGPAGTSGNADAPGSPTWPDLDADAEGCVIAYPKDLRQQPYAFDGTVTAVRLDEHDEMETAGPVRVEVAVNELFRGENIDDSVVLHASETALPPEDVAGTRILATTDHSFNLAGCGYTRPYSPSEASRWRQEFANVPAVECGKEVRDCSLGEPTPVPATCERASLEYAIATNIDHGGYPFTVLGCDRRYLSLRVDLGADACPPEATEEQRRDCARNKTAYFVKRSGGWEIITYESETRCRVVQELEPSFPSRFCSP